MSRLIRDHAIVDDDWTLVPLPAPSEETVRKQAGKVVIFRITGETAATAEQIAATAIPASGKVIVPLSVWQARRQELAPRLAAAELGLWLDSFEPIETLLAGVADINALPVIAINFPRFVDGRGFTMATLLRTRYGYRHEIRAIGDVLRDQMYFLQRCGFNAFDIRADRSAKDALAGLRDFSNPYQGAVDNPLPVWRRHVRHARQTTVRNGLPAREDEVD